MGQIKGSVTYCNETGASSFEPVVTLHHRDGKIAATRVGHSVDVPGEPTNGSVHFMFSKPAGYYYLTQGNDYPIPLQARQIHPDARQTFTAHIDDCAGSAAAVAQEVQEVRQTRQAFVKAQANMAAQRAATERVAAVEPKCTQAEVRITTSPGVPHMGGFSDLVSVENSGRTTCSLGLYPLLTFHSATSPSAYTAGPSSPSSNDPSTVPVVLAHGEAATAIFDGGDMPTGSQTSCPTFSSFTANIAEGTPVTFHTTVADCSGIEVEPFVAGFTGMYPPTGRVTGRVPICKAVRKERIGSAQLYLGPIVRVNFRARNKALTPDFVFASSNVSEPFSFDLAPGTYKVSSARGPTPKETIRVGRISQVGLFGVCSKATIPHSAVPNSTTTTTTTAATHSSVASCTADQLTGSGGWQGATQTLLGGIALTNTGRAPCELRGFLSVALLNNQDALLNIEEHDTSSPAGSSSVELQNILLPPKKANSAFISLQWSSWCGPDPAPLLVILSLPGGSKMKIPPGIDPWGIEGCLAPSSPSVLYVGPVRAH